MSRSWGFDRGLPIDRYYIEGFLQQNSADITGRALEFGSDAYSRRFGQNLQSVDVWNVAAGHPQTTIVADLAQANSVPADCFDCIICTQTLHFVYEVRFAVRELFRILAPGGVALVTVPGISQISQADMDRWGDHWRFTELSAREVFSEVFTASELTVKCHGNVMAATSFLFGLSTREIRTEELDHRDERFDLLISIRAVKPEAA